MRDNGVWHRNFNRDFTDFFFNAFSAKLTPLFSTKLTQLRASFEVTIEKLFRQQVDSLLKLCGGKFPPSINDCGSLLFELHLQKDITAFPVDYVKNSCKQIGEQVCEYSQAVLQQFDLELVDRTREFLSPSYEEAYIHYCYVFDNRTI